MSDLTLKVSGGKSITQRYEIPGLAQYTYIVYVYEHDAIITTNK